MTLLEKIQKPFADETCRNFENAMLENALMSDEERQRKHSEYEDRKCFCITTDGQIACSRRVSGGIYKVDSNMEMLDEPYTKGKFSRWATGFDL